MAYGQNDHASCYAPKTSNLLELIQKNINISGYVDVNGIVIWIDGIGCGLTRSIIEAIHYGPKKEFSQNEIYWINADARNLKNSPGVSSMLKEIYFDMFNNFIFEEYPNMERIEK